MKRAIVIIAVMVIISGVLSGCTIPVKLYNALTNTSPAAAQTK